MIPHKITPEEYHQMGPIFPDARLELIKGELFDMAPIGTAHFWTVAELTQWLTLHLAKRAFVVCQGPLSDLNARVAEVHRQPVGTGYETVTTPNPLIPLAFPDLTISLDDILP